MTTPTQAQIEAAKREYNERIENNASQDAAMFCALTAAAEADMKCGGNHRIEAIKTLTTAADVPEQEHILQKPGQKPGLLPSGNTAAEAVERSIGACVASWDVCKVRDAATIERCAQVLEPLMEEITCDSDFYKMGINDTVRKGQAAIRALKDKL